MSSTLRFVYKCGHVSGPISVKKIGNGGPTYQESNNICWNCWRVQEAQKKAEEQRNDANAPADPSRVQRGGDPEGPISAAQPEQRESISAMFHSTCGHTSQTRSLGVETVWRVFLILADDDLCWDCEVAQRAQAAQQPFQA